MADKIKLTKANVDKLTPRATPYEVHDRDLLGFLLRVQPSGVKSFVVTWARGKRRTLGKYPGLTAEAARGQALAALNTATQNDGELPAVVKDTVADACRDYVTALRNGRIQPKNGQARTPEECKRVANDAERRFERTVYADRIGKIRLAKLTQDDVEDWRDRVERGDLAELPTKKGRPPKAKPLTKASVNRMRTVLVAALNRAVERRKVSPDRVIEWANVKPYSGAGSRREIYLDRAQRRAWLAKAGDDLRDVMECIALTGCRPGDPAATLRRDYDARHATVKFRTKRHERVVPLSPAAKVLFDRLAKDKLPAAPMFTNGGKPWNHYDWAELVRAAAVAAEMPDGVVLYTLRHCWITDAIVGGMDLLTVAKLAGTSLAMIEKHYGHLVQGAARDKLAKVEFL